MVLKKKTFRGWFKKRKNEEDEEEGEKEQLQEVYSHLW